MMVQYQPYDVLFSGEKYFCRVEARSVVEATVEAVANTGRCINDVVAIGMVKGESENDKFAA